MKNLSIILPIWIFIMAFMYWGCFVQTDKNKPVKTEQTILKQNTDERGLTSVIFKEGKDTFAFDYLSPFEYGNMFNGHSCKWELCPYKGVKCAPGEWNEAVYSYTECEKGTDCYYIDMLHLQFPNDEYDQLEERLSKITKDCGNDASVFNDMLEMAYTKK